MNELANLCLDTMNETDVREVVVRPFLHELGYRHGTDATIITEKGLRYSKAFLGRKKPSKDPDLVGRADYICEVVSFGRWVVEVKAPDQELTEDDAFQAHTYAAHPEIAALFFLVTNGRFFRLYRISHPDKWLLEWRIEETIERLPTLKNILSPDAIRRHYAVASVDVGKPLGNGLKSTLSLVGGTITYLEHRSSSPLLPVDPSLNGVRATVTGRHVVRTDAGQIQAELTLAGPYRVWDTLNELAGVESYLFRTADEYISTDIEAPTIFQGVSKGRIAKGTIIPPIPGQSEHPIPLPFGMNVQSYIEAVGFLESNAFRGSFSFVMEIRIEKDDITLPTALPDGAGIEVHGVFDITFRDW